MRSGKRVIGKVFGAQKFFACAGIFVFGAIFLLAAHVNEVRATCGVDECTSCPTQDMLCGGSGSEVYLVCMDNLGKYQVDADFCQGGAAGFRCWAEESPSSCNSTGVSFDPAVITEGTFNYSCSACAVSAPGAPPIVLPPPESCTVTWEMIPSTPLEGTDIEVVVRGEQALSNTPWQNVALSVDGGGWHTTVNVMDLTPRFRFSVNAGSPGPHTLRFGVNANFGDSVLVCTSMNNATFTTVSAGGGTAPPFNIFVGFENPLKAKNLTELLDRLLNIFLVISGSLVVLMIVWAAFLFVTSEGAPQRVQQAQDAVKWAVIGFLIIVSAKAIFNIINTILPFD